MVAKYIPFQRMNIKPVFLALCMAILILISLLPPTNYAFSEEIMFTLFKGMNGISIPFENTGLNTAEELAQSIPYCESVSYWDEKSQNYIIHPKNSSENNFSLTPGHPYFVNVNENTIWTVAGNIPGPVIFNLITTESTNINCIAVPYLFSYLNTAEDLTKDIPNCVAVWYWNAENQGYIGHPLGTQINNFKVSIGYPYFVNVSEETSWPVITLLQGVLSAEPTKGAIPLEVQFSATATGGTAPYSYFWALDGDGAINNTQKSFSHIYRQCGIYNVTLTINDAAGGSAIYTKTIAAISAPTVVASANPTSGDAPLDVSFSCMATDPDGIIILFEWDFDGDGIYDWADPNTCNANHQYTKNGLYQAIIRATDNDGLTGTDSITIAVGISPTAVASAEPTTDQTPLEVTFTGAGIDTDGTISHYEWDFDGDGSYDWSNEGDGNTTYTYTSSGIFNAILKVTDNDGLIGADSVLIYVSAPPIAKPRAYPTSGEVPLTVTFFSDGEDIDGSPEYFDWDFDGDGVYDAHLLASMNATHTYLDGGDYEVTLKVTDNEGFIGTASITIKVTDPNPQGIPTAMATATPTNGATPHKVAFSGQGIDNTKITKYEWDFDGDGEYDWEESPPAEDRISGMVNIEMKGVPSFVDIDNDGDQDLFVSDWNDDSFCYYRNDGSPGTAQWTLVDHNYLSLTGYPYPAFVDIDNDGDQDLFVSNWYEDSIYFYRNDGTPSTANWTLADPNYLSITGDPTFIDIDGDSDQDLFVSNWYEDSISFYRNDGNPGSPSWTLADADYFSLIGIPVFVDIDNDDDYDLFVSDWYEETISFYQNDGNAQSPAWTLVDADYFSFSGIPAFVDIDNDGDQDLFVSDWDNYLITHYQNKGTPDSAIWASLGTIITQEYNIIEVSSYSKPFFADIDNDGDLDLFIGEEKGWFISKENGRVYWYSNDGDANSPTWISKGPIEDPNGAIDVGSRSAPTLIDIDNDEDYDLFIGNQDGNICYYQNIGTVTSPRWKLVTKTYNDIGVSSDSAPTFVDIDGDGDYDMFIGEFFSRIKYYRNDGTPTSPSWTYIGCIEDVHIGNFSTPYFIDIDHDGDYDLFCGEYEGSINFYKNDGDKHTPKWTLISSTYRDIEVNSRSAPALVDIDNDGDYDLFTGDAFGYIYFYPMMGLVTHTYDIPGDYQATLRVTDNCNLTDTHSLAIRVYPSGFPTAIASANLTAGDAPLTVSFTGKGKDPDGSISLYEWDFDGDGVYDWSNSNQGDTSYTYTKLGTFDASLRVTDNEGNTATDTVSINTTLGITTTRTDIFNPTAGETGTITITLTADTVITIKIIDQKGNVVRTLVSNESRPAGDYEYTWDGKDDSGKKVKDGIYYFLIKYRVNGETYIYDLRQDAEYKEIAPFRTWPTAFNPYEDDFATITYSLSKPSEISLYFWTRGPGWGEESIIHVKTLFTREPRSISTHKEVWDGIDDKGRVVVPGKMYPVTLWAYELPDNAIIITGDRPETTNVSAEPNYFSPVYNPYASKPTEYTIVSFTLSKKAHIEGRIINSEGILVNTFSENNLPRGANTITWDGKDLGGKLVQSGAYSIALTAIDEIGNRSLPRYAAVIVHY